MYNIGFLLSAKICLSFCQNLHLYQSLTHAQGEPPHHVLAKVLARSRSGFMGRMFGRIFGFSNFSGVRPEFGPLRPGIVLETRAVLLNTRLRVQEPVLVNSSRMCGRGFRCISCFSGFLSSWSVFGVGCVRYLIQWGRGACGWWVAMFGIESRFGFVEFSSNPCTSFFLFFFIYTGHLYRLSRGNHGWRFTARIRSWFLEFGVH